MDQDTKQTRETEGPEDDVRPSPSSPTAEELAEHMHLVHRIVAHFQRRLPRSVQREDLIAAGTLGLFYALRTSGHTKVGCPDMFASYARIRIRGAIVDELRRHDWSPRRRREPEAAAPAPAHAAPLPANVTSLPPPKPRVAVVGFDDLPPHAGALTLCEEGASPLERIEEKWAHEALHEAVELLPARERAIIKMRYFEAMPSKAIASALGLSEARISQLHARATARLREILEAEGTELELAA